MTRPLETRHSDHQPPQRRSCPRMANTRHIHTRKRNNPDVRGQQVSGVVHPRRGFSLSMGRSECGLATTWTEPKAQAAPAKAAHPSYEFHSSIPDRRPGNPVPPSHKPPFESESRQGCPNRRAKPRECGRFRPGGRLSEPLLCLQKYPIPRLKNGLSSKHSLVRQTCTCAHLHTYVCTGQHGRSWHTPLAHTCARRPCFLWMGRPWP